MQVLETRIFALSAVRNMAIADWHAQTLTPGGKGTCPPLTFNRPAAASVQMAFAFGNQPTAWGQGLPPRRKRLLRREWRVACNAARAPLAPTHADHPADGIHVLRPVHAPAAGAFLRHIKISA